MMRSVVEGWVVVRTLRPQRECDPRCQRPGALDLRELERLATTPPSIPVDSEALWELADGRASCGYERAGVFSAPFPR
jgi:hypothetical protein